MSKSNLKLIIALGQSSFLLVKNADVLAKKFYFDFKNFSYPEIENLSENESYDDCLYEYNDCCNCCTIV